MLMALQYRTGQGTYDGKIRPGSSADNVAIRNVLTKSGTFENVNCRVSRLRLGRKDNTFTVAIQEGAEGSWTEIGTWVDEDGVFNETLLIGPATGSKSTNPLSAVTITVKDTGVATFSGKLADGTPVSGTVTILFKDDQQPLIRLYQKGLWIEVK